MRLKKIVYKACKKILNRDIHYSCVALDVSFNQDKRYWKEVEAYRELYDIAGPYVDFSDISPYDPVGCAGTLEVQEARAMMLLFFLEVQEDSSNKRRKKC